MDDKLTYGYTNRWIINKLMDDKLTDGW